MPWKLAKDGISELVRKDWALQRSSKCPSRVTVTFSYCDAIKYKDPFNPANEIVALVASITLIDPLDPRSDPRNPGYPRPDVNIGMQLDSQDVGAVKVRQGTAVRGHGRHHHLVVADGESTVYQVLTGR